MKNIYLNIYKPNLVNLKKAKKNIENNNVIGMPTETVYGLAGNAYSNRSVKKIFKLKRRPAFNPLIIHFKNLKDLKNDVMLNTNFKKLYSAFCPGPITFILKKKKNLYLSPFLKKNLIKPTKIYVKELNKINEKKLINGCANITGGGLLNNVIRVIPDKLCLNINLSKIKIIPIFKWLKKNNIKDSEMLKTFNCGVGFCLITNKKNINNIKKIFSKDYQPYQIGFISKEKSKVKTFGKLQW